MSRCTRRDPVWTSADARPPPPPPPPAIETGRRKRMRRTVSEPVLGASGKDGNSKDVGSLADALVMVSFDIPYLVDGISGGEYVGTGVIFDKENGEKWGGCLLLYSCLVLLSATYKVVS